jgi:hypothetical protein
MTATLVSTIILCLFGWMLPSQGSVPASNPTTSPAPILVELFTSEGCSSCPPADRLLQDLDRQPVPGAELVVLSEHVDYWNHLGWKDPYSSHAFSERQRLYAEGLNLDGPYTPQMVVDGTVEFVGSDSQAANRAFEKAEKSGKIAVTLSSFSVDPSGTARAHLETGPLSGPDQFEAGVYVALALNRAKSQVAHGENSGRSLTHVAVLKELVKVGTVRHGQSFSQDVQLGLEPGTDSSNIRLVAFLQEPRQGRVLGAAQLLSKR